MKNVLDAALELHLRELQEFYLSQRSLESKISARDGRKLESAFAKAAARRAPRGRPPAWHSSNERTHQSREAAIFVIGEMRTFRLRHGIKRIPVKVTNAFIEFAKRMCPFAKYHIVIDYIRVNQGILPHYNEPTCFLLVRFGTADVIVAAPSDKRRSVVSTSI
jgi:hypothetical protein